MTVRPMVSIPGIIVVSSMDGATHTLSETIDVRLFGSMITRGGGG